MNDIELNHLKYFYYTVLEGGVSLAAKRLCVQQPVVSKMLKSLEEQLEQPLFWKKGRTKELTDYGQLVFRHCQVVFSEVAKIKPPLNDPKLLSGVFNIGAAEPILNDLLPDVLADLADQFPQLNLNAYTATQNQLLNMISQGQLELGCFFYAPNMNKELEVVRTFSFPFRLVIKKSKLDDEKVIHSFIGSRELDDNSSHHFPTLELVQKEYPQARIKFSSNSITLHKKLVLKGSGIAILPEFLVVKELKKGQVIDLFPNKTFSWDLMLIKRKSQELSLPAQEFLKGLAFQAQD